MKYHGNRAATGRDGNGRIGRAGQRKYGRFFAVSQSGGITKRRMRGCVCLRRNGGVRNALCCAGSGTIKIIVSRGAGRDDVETGVKRGRARGITLSDNFAAVAVPTTSRCKIAREGAAGARAGSAVEASTRSCMWDGGSDRWPGMLHKGYENG